MDARAAVDETWRSDAAAMLGVLARRLGDLDRAEEALQEAVAEALRRALALATNPAERDLLTRRLAGLSAP